jgi:hypothetical protein
MTPSDPTKQIPANRSSNTAETPSAPRMALDLKARVLAAAAMQPSPTRKVLARQSLIVTILSCGVSLVIFELAGGVRVTGRPISLILGTALGTGSLAAGAAWIALARGRSTLGRLPWLSIPVAVSAPPLILAWKVFWSARYPGGIEPWVTRPGFKCLALSLGIAACPLAALVTARRFTAPTHPAATGMVAGIAIGALANVLTDLWCPVAYAPHLLLGHVLPVAILGAAGGWLGRYVVALGRK